MNKIFLVGAGGFVGSVLRYLIIGLTQTEVDKGGGYGL
jgi:fluoride ion exporter CrcB/FEX